jgi:hypothetical protein
MHISALYESVTNSIIADLGKGVASWVKPWSGGGVGALPTNAATGRDYNGINIPILWHAALSKGYPSQGWMTFKQAQGRGHTVRAGEKGTHVFFTKKITVYVDGVPAGSIKRASMSRPTSRAGRSSSTHFATFSREKNSLLTTGRSISTNSSSRTRASAVPGHIEASRIVMHNAPFAQSEALLLYTVCRENCNDD